MGAFDKDSGSKTTGTQSTSSTLAPGVQSSLNSTLGTASNLFGNSIGSGGGFNGASYLAANPDVAANSYFASNPQAHYDQYGKNENRQGATGAANPNAPQLFKPYTESMVVPYSQATTDANNSILAGVPGAASALQNSFNGVSQIANGTGYNAEQQSAVDRFTALANGSGYNAEQQDALAVMRKYADGEMSGLSNPAFQAVVKQSQTAAQDAVQAGASAAGRYGSGIAQGNVAREVGDVTNRALAAQMNTDTANRLGAVSSLFSAGQQGLTNRMGAASSLFSAGQQGTQNRFTAAGMLPGLYDATLDPYRAQAGVGAMQEDLAGRQKQDTYRIWQEQQDQQRKAVEWMSQLSQGQAGFGATTTTTASAPKQNPFLAGLGGAASGYGSAGVGGALLGGGAGLLGGLFG